MFSFSRIQESIIALFFLSLILNSRSVAQSTSEPSGILHEHLLKSTIVVMLVLDSSGKETGEYGTGMILWDYLHPDSCYVLTATHVLQNAAKLQLLALAKSGSYESLLDSPLLMAKKKNQSGYLTYTNNEGVECDLALVPVSFANLKSEFSPYKSMVRSNCLFQDSVTVGDHLIAIGYADTRVFDFVAKNGPIATSGIIAYESGTSYLIDKRTHGGMSGGIVFKEIPALGDYVYRAVGIVSAKMSKYQEYSWITKIDFVDSILVQHTGKGWAK